MGVITRAEDFYLPPPHRPVDAWATIPPAERVIRWFEEKQQRRIVIGTGMLLGQRIYPRINHGRWVADCTCMSAQIVTPADPRMWCVECGTGWWQLVFPGTPGTVEQEMALLPVADRNWWHPDDPTRVLAPSAEESAPESPEA